jgi:hypothetical protein
MKANAYPGNGGGNMGVGDIIYEIRGKVNEAGLTGLFDLKRELVGKQPQKQPSAYERNRSRSRGRWRKGRIEYIIYGIFIYFFFICVFFVFFCTFFTLFVCF